MTENGLRECLLYGESDDPMMRNFYVGAQGKLPKVGEFVKVENALTGSKFLGRVCSVDRARLEYKVERVDILWAQSVLIDEIAAILEGGG